MKKMSLVALAVSAAIIMAALGGLAQAETISLKSDANTLGASLGKQGDVDAAARARLDSGDTTGLTFAPVIVDSLGSDTPVPTGAPTGTAVINLPGGSYYDGENGFFKMTFNLPSGFTNISLSGAANVDDCGRFFINGNPLTPSIYDAWGGNGITQYGNFFFTTNNQSFFNPGNNVILISDADFFGYGPSAGAFYVNISYAPVPVPGTLLLLGSGLLGMVGWRRFRKS